MTNCTLLAVGIWLAILVALPCPAQAQAQNDSQQVTAFRLESTDQPLRPTDPVSAKVTRYESESEPTDVAWVVSLQSKSKSKSETKILGLKLLDTATEFPTWRVWPESVQRTVVTQPAHSVDATQDSQACQFAVARAIFQRVTISCDDAEAANRGKIKIRRKKTENGWRLEVTALPLYCHPETASLVLTRSKFQFFSAENTPLPCSRLSETWDGNELRWVFHASKRPESASVDVPQEIVVERAKWALEPGDSLIR